MVTQVWNGVEVTMPRCRHWGGGVTGFGTGVECVHNRATTVNQKVVEPCFPCLLSPWASLCH